MVRKKERIHQFFKVYLQSINFIVMPWRYVVSFLLCRTVGTSKFVMGTDPGKILHVGVIKAQSINSFVFFMTL